MDVRTNLDDEEDAAAHLEVGANSMRIVDDEDEEDPLDAYMKTIQPAVHHTPIPRELPRPRRHISIAARVTKNRRYQKLQELLHESDYFSDENMELRNPGLFHLHLGNYLPAPAESTLPTADQSKLSEFLIASIQKRDLEERKANEEGLWGSSFRRKQHARDVVTEEEDNDSAFEEEVDSDEEVEKADSADDDASDDDLTIDERRAHLVDVMCQRFMQGMDVGFVKYDEIDSNAQFDLNPLAQQDLEDNYFNNDMVE